ncbi:MAG: EAL domain-containing protein [Syntrophotaleaceae bacterium]
MKKEEKLLQALIEISRELLTITDLEQLLERILRVAREVFQFDNAIIRLVSQDGLRLIPAASYGYTREALKQEILVGCGIMGKVAAQARPILVPDVTQSADYLYGIPGARSELAVPLIVEDQVVGVFNVESPVPHAFDETDLESLMTVARHASIAIKNANLYENLRLVSGRFRKLHDFSRHVLDSVNLGIFTLDSDLRITSWNCKMTGWFEMEEAEARGSHLFDLLPELAGTDFHFRLRRVLEQNEPEKCQVVRKSAEESRRHFELHLSALAEAGDSSGAVILLEDITPRIRAERLLLENEKRLNHLAFHDSLTNLPNRLLFHDRLARAMKAACRKKQQVGLLFLDLDRFKNINDSLGHQTGDELLRKVALRLRGCLRSHDTIARLGGDEFVIIVQDLVDHCDLAAIAQKILAQLAKAIRINDDVLFPTASIGIALYPDDGQDVEELMKSADVALYRAKEQGRNTYQFYERAMNARSHELLRLESHLRHALEEQQLVLHYQPQLDLKTGETVGFEALLRWKHPLKGMIAPSDFIPMAEETGLIVPIGEWVLDQACSQAQLWRSRGFDKLRVSVNISPRQFKQPGFVQAVDRILFRTGLDPRFLELEITENILVDNIQEAAGVLQQLRTMGLSLAVDDFGTGFSSLRYLQQLPLDRLKIDQSFVKGITIAAEGTSLAAGIIALAENLNLGVVAEGIENRVQLDFLRQRQCDQGQGFLFARPLTTEEATAYLHRPLTPPFPSSDTDFEDKLHKVR